MCNALTFTEIDGQNVELLPPRTVLSMFSQDLVGSAGGATGGISNGTAFGSFGNAAGSVSPNGVFGSFGKVFGN